MTMIKLKKFYLILLILCTSISGVFSIPAKYSPVQLTQPDDSKIYVLLRGDEFFHFYTTVDGYLIQKDAAGFFCYSTLDANNQLTYSTVRTRNTAERSSAENSYLNAIDKEKLFGALEVRAKAQSNKFKTPAKTPIQKLGNFPTSGNVKSLVILVQYQDLQFSVSNPNSAFHDLLNKENYSYNRGTGSVRDYFIENSTGKFQPQFDVYGPVTLSHNMNYYGGNDSWGNDQAPEQMVIEACNQLDATVDFSQYDNDNDGWVDNIYVFYAGLGEADGGSENTVWPHAWNIYTGAGETLMVDEKQVGSYSCSNEKDGTVLTGIGTFTHEFCHVLGLPDLYATSYTSAFTPGEWSILDYGPYNNQGKTPPYMSVYERYSLGWLEPVELNTGATVSLKNIANNEGFIIKTNKSNEYFMVENRQKSNWDAYIPGHGMLVWHIDYNESVWSGNTVNNTASHQYVDIEEADGTQTESSRAGDAFPGTSGKTEFTDATSPGMKTWAGVSLNKPITNIVESGGLVTFNFMGGKAFEDVPVVSAASDITPISFVASWSALEGADHYELDVYKQDANLQKIYVDGFHSKNVGDVLTYKIEGLEPATKYFLVVRGANQFSSSDNSEIVEVTTLDPTFDYLAPVASSASSITPNSFVANWELLTDATKYFIDVYKKAIGTPESYSNINFNNKLSDFPTGWETNTASFYASTGYYGTASPALRLEANALYIQTPVFDKEIRAVKFWYRGASASVSNSLTISGFDGTNWKEIKVIKPLKNEVGGETVTIDASSLMRIYSIRFTYNRISSGNLALDDISVGYGGVLDVLPLAEYTSRSVGSVLNHEITGLESNTDYYYVITAGNGSLTSKKSNEIKVTTGLATDISQINKQDSGVAVTSQNIIVRLLNGDRGRLQIFNVNGQLVFSETVSQEIKIARDVFPHGIYFLKLDNKVTKIIL